MTRDLTVTITENDSPGLVISQSAFTVVEGDRTGQSYTVALVIQPSAAVTVTISGQAGSDLVVDKPSLSFSTSNWSAAQTVTVTARDDADALTDPVVTLTHRASGGDYGAVTGDLRVTITEDDVPMLIVINFLLTVTEGDPSGSIYGVVLATQPSATVTVAISGQAGSDLVVDPSSLTFTTTNWGTPQGVTVTASHDADALTDPPVTLIHRASGGDYGSVGQRSLSVSIYEDDVPAVTVSFAAGTYTVAEGMTLEVTVTLSAPPGRTVVIPITKTNQGGASNDDYIAVGVPGRLTFGDNETRKTIRFEAVDDVIDDDGESVLLGFGTIRQPLVSVGTIPQATVTITEDDSVSAPGDIWLLVGQETSGLPVSYTDRQGTGHTATVNWGDGSAAVLLGSVSGGTFNLPSHTYWEPGIYTVTVTVANSEGDSSSASFVARVGADVALGAAVTSSGLTGNTFEVVDDRGDTSVSVAGSWSVEVDLGDAFRVGRVRVAPPTGGTLAGFKVEGRTTSSGTWQELGRVVAAGGGTVTVSAAGGTWCGT